MPQAPTGLQNVSVIGSYRPTEEQARLAFDLGRLLIRHDFNLICGGRKGVMSEVSRGVREGRRAQDRGVAVGLLPGDDRSEGNPFLDVCIPTGVGYLRNGLVVQAGDAVIAIGGRAGTLSELALAWQMDKPIAFLGRSDWCDIWRDRTLDDRRDHEIPLLESPDEALTWLRSVLVDTIES